MNTRLLAKSKNSIRKVKQYIPSILIDLLLLLYFKVTVGADLLIRVLVWYLKGPWITWKNLEQYMLNHASENFLMAKLPTEQAHTLLSTFTQLTKVFTITCC